MDGIVSKLRLDQFGKGPRRIVAVAAYEDRATDSRVSEFCRALARHLGCEFEIVRQMWLLSELRLPRLREVAAGEAASADLVIVSIHNCPQVPQEVARWIELSLGREGKCPALLLGFLDPEHEGDSAPLRAFLAQAAFKAKLELLVQCAEAPTHNLP